MATSTFEQLYKIWLVASWIQIITSEFLFQNIFILRTTRVGNSAGIMQIFKL